MKGSAEDLLISLVPKLEGGVVFVEMGGMQFLGNMKLLEENMQMESL